MSSPSNALKDKTSNSMMDAYATVPLSENGDFENGIHQKLPIAANANGTSNGSLNIEGLCENLETAIKLNDNKILSSTQEITEKTDSPPESHLPNNPKELEVKESDVSKNLKPLKSMVKAKNGKPLGKGRDGKEAMKPTNGNIALKTKSKSFNGKQSASVQDKLHGIPDATLSSTSGEQSEETPEKTKLKALKKGPASKTEDISQSSSSPTAVDAKPARLGTLPAYSFSFKCNERAEKRKEFYTELEKKIQEKEAEKNNMQAKSKETQDAEMRLMRKKLGFKATPMPSFYQEPAPPKAELKKIPTTRAKSPKLGRKKCSPIEGTKENGAALTRLSLDAKMSAKRVDHVKKPHRQSLPRLPFEDPTGSPNEKKRVASRKTTISKETGESKIQPKALIEETGKAANEPIKNQPSIDEELPEAQKVTDEVQEA